MLSVLHKGPAEAGHYDRGDDRGAHSYGRS
jgi:hypothetical protein